MSEKPPEKIYLNYFDDTGNPMFDGFSPSPKPDETARVTFEYHLAPVWLDAVKEQPKVEVMVLMALGKDVIKGYFDGKHWRNNSGYLEATPSHWMPLPLPPERSGE
jgi:hypothetical protein